MKNFYFVSSIFLSLLFLPFTISSAQWIQTIGPIGHTITSLIVSPPDLGDTNLFAGTDGDGVFLSTNNGTNWTTINSGLINPYVNSLAFSSNGEGGINLFAGISGTPEMFLSTDNGKSWTAAINSGITGYLTCLAVSKANLFAGTFYNGVFLSTNNGKSWSAIDSGFNATQVSCFIFSDSNLFAGTSVGVFLSTNNGKSWSAVDSGLTSTKVYCLVANNTNLFVGTYDGGVFLSTNKGTSWKAINSGLTSTYIRCFTFCGNNIFAGTYNRGVFLSTNNGMNWKAVNSGLTDTLVRCLAVSGNYLFAGTSSGGVWRRLLSEMITSVERISTNLPTYFSLNQNYPNPFNPSTTISFSLPSKSYVSLKIIDALGREVATLLNEELSAGNYTRQWNAMNMSSGIYFYRLNAGTFTETKKLVLLR